MSANQPNVKKGKPRLPNGIAAPVKGTQAKAPAESKASIPLMAKTRALEWAQANVEKRKATDRPKVWAFSWEGDAFEGSYREVLDLRANVVAGLALKAMGIMVTQAITDTLAEKGSAAERLNRALALAGIKSRSRPNGRSAKPEAPAKAKAKPAPSLAELSAQAIAGFDALSAMLN